MPLLGCDYNHWLIVMEFPKDKEPSVEQMVQTYEETCAKGLNIRGLPGVIFVLPDVYIDPANKDYGGDKYINGTIIPRPHPVRYERQGRSEEEEELTLFIEEEQRRNWGLSNTKWWGPSHIDQSFLITPSVDVDLQESGSTYGFERRRTYFIGTYH